MSGTRVQRSPGSALPRRAAEREERHAGAPRRRSAALAEMRRAKGWVASMRRSTARLARQRARPSAPPKPPMRSAPGCGAGSRVRPASERVTRRPGGRRAGRRARAPRRCRRGSGCAGGPCALLGGSRRAVSTGKWLAVVGIGEDGVAGLGEAARAADRGGGGGVRRAAAPGAGGGADPRRGAGLAEPVRRGGRCWRCAGGRSACWPRAIRSCTGSAATLARQVDAGGDGGGAGGLGLRPRGGAAGLGAAGGGDGGAARAAGRR